MKWVDGRAWLWKRRTILVSAYIWLEQRKWEIGLEGKGGQTKESFLQNIWSLWKIMSQKMAHRKLRKQLNWGKGTGQWQIDGRGQRQSQRNWWEMMGWGKRVEKTWTASMDTFYHIWALAMRRTRKKEGRMKNRERGRRKEALAGFGGWWEEDERQRQPNLSSSLRILNNAAVLNRKKKKKGKPGLLVGRPGDLGGRSREECYVCML